MHRVILKAKMDPKRADALKGKLIGDDAYDLVVTGTTAVHKPDGTLLFKLVKNAISSEILDGAHEALRHLRTYGSDNRGAYAGMPRKARVKADGTVSKTTSARNVPSAIIGYFDRNPRMPFCRETAFTAKEVQRWQTVVPLAQAVSDLMRKHVPQRWRAQQEIVQQTSKDFVIEGTVFTTMTVNNSVRAAVHRDKGDYLPGFGCMTVQRKGDWTGGYLVYPEYRVAAAVGHGDAIFFDPHELHGNTLFEGLDPEAGHERISCVYYYRTKMSQCGSATEELGRARDRARDVGLRLTRMLSERRCAGRPKPGRRVPRVVRPRSSCEP